MIQTKKITVSSDMSQKRIEDFAAFGYELVQTEEVEAPVNSTRRRSAFDINASNGSERVKRYVSLTFQIDSERKNCDKLSALNNIFENNLDESYINPSPKNFIIWFSLAVVFYGLFFFFVKFKVFEHDSEIIAALEVFGSAGLGFISFCIGAGMLGRFIRAVKIKKAVINRNIDHKRIREECLDKASKLL